MFKKIHSIGLKIVTFLSRADLFFYALLWLMILLFLGTFNQKFIGLYAAQKIYFSEEVVWFFNVIPMPGGIVTMAVVLLGLCAKLGLEEWNSKKIGTIVIHISVVMLLFGGFLTARYSVEGNMQIAEGQQSNFMTDYYDLELVVRKLATEPTQQSTEIAFRQGWLDVGSKLNHELVPFEIDIKSYCHNCAIFPRDEEGPQLDNLRGVSKYMALSSLPRVKEEESNHSGLTLSVSGVDEGAEGLYTVFEFMPVVPKVKVGAETYELELRHKRSYLPFAIELKDFEKQVYAATNMAKSYQSDVILKDDGQEWRSLIQMNDPLRYKGYTFFQSSFVQAPQQETTILAVVKNVGRLFPYVSSILLCIGLLIHLFQRVPELMCRLKEGKE